MNWKGAKTMKSDRAIMENVRAAIDDCTRGIDEAHSLHDRILQKVKGEEPVARKISAAFIIALALATVSVTALAAALLWHDAGEKIAPLEGRNGYYDTWSPDAKTELIQILYDLGELKGNADAERLLCSADMEGEEKDALCDQIMTAYVNGASDTVALLSILEKLHGDISTWPQEDKAWYNGLLQKNQMLTEEDANYVLPAGGDLTQEQAVEMAREFLAGKGAKALDQARIEAVLTEDTEDFSIDGHQVSFKGRRAWEISFELNQEGLPYGGSCHVALQTDGAVLDYAVPELAQIYMTGLLPDADAIPQEEALALGVKAIADAFKTSENELTGVYAYFGEIDIKNEAVAHAAWKTRLWAIAADGGYYALLSPAGEVVYVGNYGSN